MCAIQNPKLKLKLKVAVVGTFYESKKLEVNKPSEMIPPESLKKSAFKSKSSSHSIFNGLMKEKKGNGKKDDATAKKLKDKR